MIRAAADRVGTLMLVATPIGNLGDITARAVELLRSAEVIACEDTRRTGRLLAHLGVAAPRLIVVNEHTEHDRVDEIIDMLRSGRDVVLVSDAGMPAISDPGQRLVAAVVAADLPVGAAPGASSPLVALVISGLPTSRFVMEGFLPRKGVGRTERLAAIATEQRTIVLLESPKRLRRTLADLARVCGEDRPAAVARELTKLHEECVRGSLGELIARFDSDPRGEIVVVVGGAPDRREVDDDILRDELAGAIAEGSSTRDAVDAVASRHGVPRNRVYRLAVE